MSPVFAHGQLRLYLLALLDEGPRHGYEIIQEIGERTGGVWRPSRQGTARGARAA